jgi:glycerol-3-phosphate acyltransferase PlsY
MGSIPFGVLLTRPLGIDLRNVGSGNIGATNVLRAAGGKIALLTLLGDILKGTAAVAVGKVIGAGPLYEGVFGIAAVAGHNFSPFMRFRGGKGVATSIGVILIYVPMAGIITIILWLATVLITRYSSLGALVSFALMPYAAYLFGYPYESLAVSAILTVLLFIRHLGNINRLIKGSEGKVGHKA